MLLRAAIADAAALWPKTRRGTAAAAEIAGIALADQTAAADREQPSRPPFKGITIGVWQRQQAVKAGTRRRAPGSAQRGP